MSKVETRIIKYTIETRHIKIFVCARWIKYNVYSGQQFEIDHVGVCIEVLFHKTL